MSFGDKKLSEIAVSVPGSTSLLREYDLDFCCGGSDTLANAAAEKGLNLAEIETRLTELQNSKAKGYVYDKEKDTLTEKEVPEKMKKEALAHALLGSYLYKNRLYKGSEEK